MGVINTASSPVVGTVGDMYAAGGGGGGGGPFVHPGTKWFKMDFDDNMLDSGSEALTITENGAAASYETTGAADGKGRKTVTTYEFSAPYDVGYMDWWNSSGFTVECSVYYHSTTNLGYGDHPTLLGNFNDAGVDTYWAFGVTPAQKLEFYYWTGAIRRHTGTTTINLNQRYDIAMTHDTSGDVRLFVDGALELTEARVGTPQHSATFPLQFIEGFGDSDLVTIDNLLITWDECRYTSAYTPTSTPWSNT